jgi:hypothetical protein
MSGRDFEDADGFVGITGLKRLETGAGHEVHSAHADERTVFDNQNDSLAI